MKHIFIIAVLSFSIALTGCGDGKVGLKGKVTFSDYGSPLTTGMVYFDNGKELARGRINADGTYVVGSLSKKDGLAPGHYKIYVQAIGPDPSGTIGVHGLKRQVPLIDSKFTSVETSGLECHVERSTKSYDIVVDRPANGKKQ